jgi:thioredoxin 1
MSEPIHVTDAAFEETVLKSTTPVIVDFWAPWCVPCRMVASILESLAVEYDGKVIVAKVNTGENPEWALKYGVQGIPVVLFVRDGQIVDRMVGAAPHRMIKARVEKLIAPVAA